MSTLSDFPLLNQNADASEPNRAFDCVPACLAASLTHLLGKPFDPGAIKDAVYGHDYVGGTDAVRYVEYCQTQGVKLYQITGEPAALIVQAHSLLAHNSPSIITIPDPYMPASSGWTHAEVFHADASGTLTALDPYVGKDITKSDAEWEALLQGNMLWVLALLNTPGTPAGWHDDGVTLTAPNGVVVVKGFRQWVLSHSWDAENWPLQAEQGLNPLEASNPALGSGTQQIFRWLTLEWTPERGVFNAWTGQELLYVRKKWAELYAFYKNITSTPIG